MNCARGVAAIWKEKMRMICWREIAQSRELTDVDSGWGGEEESMVTERIMISLAEREGSEGGLEIKVTSVIYGRARDQLATEHCHSDGGYSSDCMRFLHR